MSWSPPDGRQHEDTLGQSDLDGKHAAELAVEVDGTSPEREASVTCLAGASVTPRNAMRARPETRHEGRELHRRLVQRAQLEQVDVKVGVRSRPQEPSVKRGATNDRRMRFARPTVVHDLQSLERKRRQSADGARA
jgi:hypothetical protein